MGNALSSYVPPVIAAAKGMSGTAHYALQATAEVSAEEARANLKTLEKNLKKQVQRRRWS